MQWRNTSTGYGLVQIVLHWTTVLMIATLIPLGFWMTGLDYYDPWYKRGPDIHRALGVLLGSLLLARLLWRYGQVAPRSHARHGWEARTAAAVHALLYLLPLLLVTSGYLLSTADGRSVAVFDWFEIPATLHGIEHQEDIAGDIHLALATVLLALIALHVGAALHHHFVRKDDSLRRMLSPQQASRK